MIGFFQILMFHQVVLAILVFISMSSLSATNIFPKVLKQCKYVSQECPQKKQRATSVIPHRQVATQSHLYIMDYDYDMDLLTLALCL